MGEEDELEMLLGEIPYATSSIDLRNQTTEKSNHTMYGMFYNDLSCHLKHTTCGSPVNGFYLPSDGSSSSILSNSNDSLSPPLSDEIPSNGNSHYPNLLSTVFNVSDNPIGNLGYEYLGGESNLTDHMSRFCISDETDSNRFQSFDRPNLGARYGSFSHCGNPLADPNGFHFVNHSVYGANRFKVESFGNFAYGGGVLSENSLAHLNRTQFGDSSIYGTSSTCETTKANVGYKGGGSSSYGLPQSSVLRSHRSPDEETHSSFPGPFSLINSPGVPYSSLHCTTKGTYVDYSMNDPFIGSPLLVGQPNRINLNEECLIIPGEGSNFAKQKEFGRVRACGHKGSSNLYDIGLESPRGKSLNSRACNSPVPPPTCESLVEVRGYIPAMAKDQDGCRFLQRIFDEGTPQDMQIIFSEIIGHVVELMVDPFGNYLMQKLLEVCDEDQRIQILIVLTEKPGQLIRISLNTHGTRVVQKLIETLKTKQQVSLVISALESGFLALIKDLNGNHVIKQCLQSLSNEDNRFIFVAVSKYCIEVANHQHGCCVLQCCISLLTGNQREKLVKEISANGILLAQDEYGNFVIQFILELEIPSVTSILVSQFEGNFVHLAKQKFSSHVVEKCLAVFDNDVRSKIVQELLSAPRFKELLQDPYANYVIGKAIKVTEGSRIHNVLVETIQCHESVLRNCPYSKKLLSALKQYRETTASRKSVTPRSF